MKAVTTISLLLLLIIAGCKGQDGDTKRLSQSLSKFDLVHPDFDAQRYYRNGDGRYIACLGEAPGPYFPGVPQPDWKRIQKEGDYRMIEGTSDAIESDRHKHLIDKAVAYAGVYNKTIQHMKATDQGGKNTEQAVDGKPPEAPQPPR